MPKESDKKQYEILILLALLFLAIGGFCYFSNKKDSFAYDPTLRYEDVNYKSSKQIDKIRTYFQKHGADIDHSVTDRRSFLACAACKNNWETPSACSYCQQYVSGSKLLREAV